MNIFILFAFNQGFTDAKAARDFCAVHKGSIGDSTYIVLLLMIKKMVNMKQRKDPD